MGKLNTLLPSKWAQGKINKTVNNFLYGYGNQLYDSQFVAAVIDKKDFQNIFASMKEEGVVIFERYPLRFRSATDYEAVIQFKYGHGSDFCYTVYIMSKTMDTEHGVNDTGFPGIKLLQYMKTYIEENSLEASEYIPEIERYIDLCSNNNSVYTLDDIRGMRSIYRRCGGWDWAVEWERNLLGEVIFKKKK